MPCVMPVPSTAGTTPRRTCQLSIQSGVKACTMCRPDGASEESRIEGMDTNRVPCAVSILRMGWEVG